MTARITISEVRSEDDRAATLQLCDGYRNWTLGFYPKSVSKYFSPERWGRVVATLFETHAPPDGEILLARVDGHAVGCGMIQSLEPQICEMKRLFVTPEAQGHGIGRRLCERLMHIGAERGYRTMRLDAGKAQEVARALYKRTGFRERTPYHDYPPDLLPYLIFMEADLTDLSSRHTAS
jgi:GNAT superfamily N-acetyltransferase